MWLKSSIEERIPHSHGGENSGVDDGKLCYRCDRMTTDHGGKVYDDVCKTLDDALVRIFVSC